MTNILERETREPLSQDMSGYPDDLRVFGSPGEFAAWLKAHPLPETPKLSAGERKLWLDYLPSNASYPSTQGHDNAVDTYDEAMKLLTGGWPEGRDKMLSWEGDVRHALARQVEMPHYRLGEEGSEVEMGRYMNGEPEHVLGYGVTETRALSPLILIDFNLACVQCESRCCDHSPSRPDWLMMRGAVLFLLVRLMRQSGLYPEVWVGTSALYDDHTHTYGPGSFSYRAFERGDFGTDRQLGFDSAIYRIPNGFRAKKRSTFIRVLEPGGFLDPSVTAFMLAHDSLCHRLQFRMEESLNFQEGGVFPMWVCQERFFKVPFLGRNSPVDVGIIPTRNHSGTPRDHATVRPAWHRLLGTQPGRTVIRVPSYTALYEAASYADRHNYGDEGEVAKKAIGAFGNPTTAAEYLLGILTDAGVRLK